MNPDRRKWRTKSEAAVVVMEMLPYHKGGATIDRLVHGKENDPLPCSTNLSASECRRAIGWLYGRGRVRVAEVRDGQEVWVISEPKQLAQR